MFKPEPEVKQPPPIRPEFEEAPPLESAPPAR